MFVALNLLGESPDAREIVRRSVEQNKKDWALAPQYAFTKRDVVAHKEKVTSRRTYKVLMIDGSPYNQLIATDGHPLPGSGAAVQQGELTQETARRKHEPPEARRRRIAAYEKDRAREQTLMNEMVNAFDFKLTGQEEINGHHCYVLQAAPRAGYRPTSNETKVLTGMRGTMWIDTQEYQWVKVQAEVFRPVPIDLFIADVQPGTEFLLEKVPVAQGLWLPAHFLTRVRATALKLWSKNYSRDETYFDYHRSGVPGDSRSGQ
jgi:hypothetical protein